MFRKIMIVAIPTAAFVLTLFVTDNSSSQAFARGGVRGGHNFGHRGYGRYFRSSYRYGWGYPSYGYEVPVCEPVAPVCASCEPVVAPPVTPVCTTCEPNYVAVDSGYAPYWRGYRHYGYHGRFDGRGMHSGGRRR
jgi:hypothetical protein